MTSEEDVNVQIKLGADLSGGVQSREELSRVRAEARKTTAESSTGFTSLGKSVEGVSKAAGLFGKILSGFGVIGVFTSLIAGLEKISSLFSENAGKARELKDAARAEELTKSVGDLADAYAKVKQELQEAAKEQDNALELIDAEVKARRDLRNAESDASEQKELAAIDANAEDAAERKAVIQAKYQHVRETGTANDRVEDLVLQRQKLTTAAGLDDKEAEAAANQAKSLREEARKYMSAAAEEGSKSTQLNERDRNGFLAKFAGNIKDIVTFNWGNKFGQEETAEGDEIRKAYAERQKEYQKKAVDIEKQAAEQDRVAEGKRKDADHKRRLADAMNGSVEAAQIAEGTAQVKSNTAENDASNALQKKRDEKARERKEYDDAKQAIELLQQQKAELESKRDAAQANKDRANRIAFNAEGDYETAKRVGSRSAQTSKGAVFQNAQRYAQDVSHEADKTINSVNTTLSSIASKLRQFQHVVENFEKRASASQAESPSGD